jgi:hypothetical protein
LSADESWTAEIGVPEDQFTAFAWSAWKKARRKLLTTAPYLKELSQHKRRRLRQAALQDPEDGGGLSDEEIAEELANITEGAMDPVSKVARLTLSELALARDKLSISDALRLRMASQVVRFAQSDPPVLLLMGAVVMHELADQFEIERAREDARATPRGSRNQKNSALISAALELRRRQPNLSATGIATALQKRAEWNDLSVTAIRKRLTGTV